MLWEMAGANRDFSAPRSRSGANRRRATAGPGGWTTQEWLRQGLLIVIARAVGPKQSQQSKEGLLRGVYPERSRRARNDGEDSCKALTPGAPMIDSRMIRAVI